MVMGEVEMKIKHIVGVVIGIVSLIAFTAYAPEHVKEADGSLWGIPVLLYYGVFYLIDKHKEREFLIKEVEKE
jgi:hypothetical protein